MSLNADGFPEEDFAKLDLASVEWWTQELHEAEASVRRLRRRLLDLGGLGEAGTALRGAAAPPWPAEPTSGTARRPARQRAYRRRSATRSEDVAEG